MSPGSATPPPRVYVDCGVSLSAGVNGVGLRACELVTEASRHVPASLLSPWRPHPDVFRVWPFMRWSDTHIRTPRGVRQALFYGYATPLAVIEDFKLAG